MTKEMFLSQLRSALSGNMDSGKVEENIRYYNEYISGEVQNGKTEEEVLRMLGEPWILARTLIDADNGTDQETVYEAGGTFENQNKGWNRTTDMSGNSYQEGRKMWGNESETWWKKLLLILFVIMIVLLVVAIVSGVIRIFAPIVLPILVVLLVVRVIGGKRR